MEAIRLLDVKLFYLLNHGWHNIFFDYALAFLTELGNFKFSLGVGLVCVFYPKKRVKLFGVLLLAGGFIAYGVLSVLKPMFNVVRPCQALTNVYCVIQAAGHSFPSGHACFAFMLATLARIIIKQKLLLYALAIIVAYSRVYLGVHYPSDVAAGALIGFIAGFSMLKLYPPSQKTAGLPGD